MLATTDRTRSIISGGSAWRDRAARQAETEICRAARDGPDALRPLEHRDAAGNAGGVRVLEDNRQGIAWTVDPEGASVSYRNLDVARGLPWCFQEPVST